MKQRKQSAGDESGVETGKKTTTQKLVSFRSASQSGAVAIRTAGSFSRWRIPIQAYPLHSDAGKQAVTLNMFIYSQCVPE